MHRLSPSYGRHSSRQPFTWATVNAPEPLAAISLNARRSISNTRADSEWWRFMTTISVPVLRPPRPVSRWCAMQKFSREMSNTGRRKHENSALVIVTLSLMVVGVSASAQVYNV